MCEKSLCPPAILQSLIQSFSHAHRGAKTALTLALESPHLIKDVVAIDNGPIHLPLKSDFLGYLQGLARLQEERITSHRQADEILAAYEKVNYLSQ